MVFVMSNFFNGPLVKVGDLCHNKRISVSNTPCITKGWERPDYIIHGIKLEKLLYKKLFNYEQHIRICKKKICLSKTCIFVLQQKAQYILKMYFQPKWTWIVRSIQNREFLYISNTIFSKTGKKNLKISQSHCML